MPTGKQRGSALRWLPQTLAVFLLSGSGWIMLQNPDPMYGITRQDLNVIGSVRSIVSEDAQFVLSPDGLVEGPRRTAETITFDAAGRLESRVQFDARERIELVQNYVYSNSWLISLEEYKGVDAAFTRTQYTHEAPGRQTVADVYNADGELQERRIYTRNEEGRIVQTEEYDGSGTLLFTLHSTVEENEARVDRFDAEGQLHSWSIRTTNEDGHLIAMSLHSPGFTGAPFTTRYEVDDRGHVTRVETSGSIVLGILTVTPGETLRSHEYTYDDQGNWVERVTSVWITQATPPRWQTESITYRTITY